MSRIRTGLESVGMVMVMGAVSLQAAVTNPENFESYSTGAWTPAGPPTSTNEGWTVSAISGAPVFGLDSDSGLYGASKGLRIDASMGATDKGLATWHASADINALPQQTLYAEWQGVFRRPDSFGRVVFNQTSANANFLEMRSDSPNFVTLRYDGDPGAGTSSMDAVLPFNNVPFTWPSNSFPTTWYTLEIQSDYASDKIRARFGNRPNLVDPTVWNDYTPWLDMLDTSQQTEVRMFVEGRAHVDNFSLLITGPTVIASTNMVVADTAGISFNSVSGVVYRLEATPDLVSSNFNATGAFVTGLGGPMALFDPTGTSTSKNYRVVATN